MANFWRRFGRGLQQGAGAFFDAYQVLTALQEAKAKREEDQRQFNELSKQRERETNISQSQWRYEQEQQERENAFRKQQMGVAQLQDTGLRAPMGVLQDIVQPPAMAEFYGGRFVQTPEFGQFGDSLAPAPMGFGEVAPDSTYGIGEPTDPLSVLREANQTTRDRQAQEALLQHDKMLRELGRRQTAIRQRQADPNYPAGAPMALDAPVLAKGGPTYGEFRGVSQEDLTHPSLRPQELTPRQAELGRRQERMDLLASLREQRLRFGQELELRQQEMRQMLQDPEMFDRQLQEWRSPQAKAAYDAAQDRYSRQKLQSDELQRTLDAIQRQMFPGVPWPDNTPQTPPKTPLPGHGTPERGRTGAMTLPDPNPGETAAGYMDRMEEAGYDMRNAQVEANIREKIRQWQLPLGRGSTRSPRDTLDALGNYSSPYTQY